MGIPRGTYSQHENGIRGVPKDSAMRYARFFKTTPEWILYGRAGTGEPSPDDLEQMIREALEEVLTVETRIADLPRILAPNVHEQLERFRADRASRRIGKN